jgi:hypothetical protein
MAATLGANLLLGWMSKTEAVNWLREACSFDPPLTEQQAIETWETYRRRVEALPERQIDPPERHPIPNNQKPHVSVFLNKFRGPEVLDVVKVDPRKLVVYQLYVVADRADHHAKTAGEWTKKTLVLDRPLVAMPWRIENEALKITLPHAEHGVWMNPNGTFGIQQFAGFVSVTMIEGRLLLKAGYHRSFAFARTVINEPDAKDRSVLVALTKSLPPQLEPSFPDQGLRTTVLGSRPPLFSDFFDVDLAMTVKLHKKRYEAHFQARIVAVNDI